MLHMKLSSVFSVILLGAFTYTSQLFLSPVYIFFIFFTILAAAYFIVPTKKNTVDYNLAFGMIGLAFSAVALSITSDFGTFINFFMVVILVFIYPFMYKGYSIKVNNTVYLVFSLLLVLYSIEAANRFINPIVPPGFLEKADESLLFYQYKYNSIMFTDSNFVALSLISLLSIVTTLFSRENFKKIFMFIILLLIILTLSRAAYVATMVLIFLQYSDRKSKALFVIFASVIFVLFLPVILNDGSYLSKLKIIELLQVYITKVDFLTLLVGSGIGNSVSALGIGAHNLFVLLIVEYGLIGFIWFISYVIYNVFSTSFKTMPYWAAIFICGFSLGAVYPFIFLPALVITYQEG